MFAPCFSYSSNLSRLDWTKFFKDLIAETAVLRSKVGSCSNLLVLSTLSRILYIYIYIYIYIFIVTNSMWFVSYDITENLSHNSPNNRIVYITRLYLETHFLILLLSTVHTDYGRKKKDIISYLYSKPLFIVNTHKFICIIS